MKNLCFLLVGCFFSLLLYIHFLWRYITHSEDYESLKERQAKPTINHHYKNIIWIHGASIGEIKSAFALADMLILQDSSLKILMTTVTITGKNAIKEHPLYGIKIFHQLIPYDIPRWVKRFFNTWSPRTVIFIEQEIWPFFIIDSFKRHIPFIIINAHMSDQSFKRWFFFKYFSRFIFEKIAWISPASKQDGILFKKLGTKNILSPLILKEFSDPLPYHKKELDHYRNIFKEKFILTAASTHPGEEELLIKHLPYLKKYIKNLFLIIIPRYPNKIKKNSDKYNIPLKSDDKNPSLEKDIWIIDSFGEVGLFYRLSQAIIIGNSLLPPGGGHNVYEAIRLGCPTSIGHYNHEWKTICEKLNIPIMTDINALKNWLEHVLKYPDKNTIILPPRNEELSSLAKLILDSDSR